NLPPATCGNPPMRRTPRTQRASYLSTLAGSVLVGAASAAFPPAAQLPARPELPDPLVLFNGQRVASEEQWLRQRRPELKELFQHYMYGYLPPAPEKVEAKVERTDRSALGGKATLKEVTVTFGPPEMPAIHLLLVVPTQRPGPAPVFVGMNFSGNHT